jgi:hypothetical protein
MSIDDEGTRSAEEWNRIDRGDSDLDRDHEELARNPLEKADDTKDATVAGAGSEPPD